MAWLRDLKDSDLGFRVQGLGGSRQKQLNLLH